MTDAVPPTAVVNWAAHVRYVGCDVRVPVRYRESGGELLILLHGLGCSKESFDGAFAAACLRDYSICALDFPGHGAATGPHLPGHLCTLASCAGITRLAVWQLLERRGRRHARVHVAGHSMGGAVAVLLATGGWPVSGCTVSIDGNLTSEDCGIVSRTIASQDLADYTAKGHSRLIAGLLRPGQPGLSAWAGWLARADPAAVHTAARSLTGWSDSGDLLAGFNALPVRAFLYGSREDKKHLLGRLKGAAVSVVPGAGHFPMIDAPGPFYQALSRALAPKSPAAAPPPMRHGRRPGL